MSRKTTPAANRLLTALPYAPDAKDEPEFVRDLERLFESRLFTNRGPLVLRFETELQAYLGNPRLNVVTFCNATAALELSLKAMGLRGKVVVTPFTFVATVHAIMNAGLEPVFADIDPVTLCLSPESVQKKLGPGVSAVLPVHAYGTVCDIEAFDELRRKGIRVLYDSAHAFGVRKDGVQVGNFGSAEVFSFHATKVLHSFEGGAVTTDDAEFAHRLRLMTNFGIVNETEVECVGTNAKMSEIHALMGLYSLRKIDALIAARREVAAAYRERLEGLEAISFVAPQPGVEPNSQYFPILLRTPELRDSLFNHLRGLKIVARRYFYPPIHQLKPYRWLKPGKLPVTESVSARILCLPMHSSLTAEDVDFVSGAIRDFLREAQSRKAA